MVPLSPLLILALTLALSACASKPVEPYTTPAPEYALPAQDDGAFFDIVESAIEVVAQILADGRSQ